MLTPILTGFLQNCLICENGVPATTIDLRFFDKAKAILAKFIQFKKSLLVVDTATS